MNRKSFRAVLLLLGIVLTTSALVTRAEAACIMPCSVEGSRVQVPHGCCLQSGSSIQRNYYRYWVCTGGCLLPSDQYVCTFEVCTGP